MKSQRLTTDLKDKIWGLICEEKFRPEEEKIKAERKDFGDLCYNFVYTEDERKYMATAPPRAFESKTSINIYLGGRNVTVPLNGPKPVFYDDSFKNKFNHDHILTEKFITMDAAHEIFRGTKKEARKQIFCIMNSCTTTKKLAEVWPECGKYINMVVDNPTTIHLPAVNIVELNKILNL